MRIYIEPTFRGVDQGEGGIRRVVEAQHFWLPDMGFEIVESVEQADLVVTHAANRPHVPVGTPWVVHCHGLYWREYPWPAWCFKMNREVIAAMRQADHVTAPSEWVAQTLRRGMWLQPSVLYHGVNPTDWHRIEDHEGYVLWNKTRPDAVCDPQSVITLAEMLPHQEFISTFCDQPLPNVQVCGVQGYEQAKSLIQQAGVYLCTTRETFGIGTLEAMASGVPVVGWDWGGQREIIEHGVTGWLAQPGDFDSLTEGISWAFDNRDRIGTAARVDVLERWTWEQAMKRYATLYTDLISQEAHQKSHPTVSVVIPCYNLAQYLPDTIKSLQAQTRKDWEAIIVNDASTDNSQEVAQNLMAGDPRIRLVKHTHNRYLAGALNTGMKNTLGRYLLPLDADNMLAPRVLEHLVSALHSDRSIDIAYGGVQFVQEDGVTPDDSVGKGGRSGWPQAFSFGGQMNQRNQLPSTSMYRREVWESSGGYRRRWRTSEDADFWSRAVSIGFQPRKVTEADTLIYRQRDDSMSRNNPIPEYIAWYPWSRDKTVLPFGAACEPDNNVNQGLSWPVTSYEPPMVSIIIPVGPDHAELVIDALDSVQAQTVESWECIIGNATGHALERIPPWAKVIDLPGGTGPAQARNAALKQATASWILPLDADDFLQPEALEKLLRAAEECGGKDVVVYSQWWETWGNQEAKVYDPPVWVSARLLSEGCIHAVTALYPRWAVGAIGGFDEHLTHWEDWGLQIDLARMGICGIKVPEPLFTYRKRTGRRREENYAAFDEGKAMMLAKYSLLWDGKEHFMPCGGCPGGRQPAQPPLVRMQSSNSPNIGGNPTGELVFLEYQGNRAGTMMFRGKSTNAQYRFGDNFHDRRKYVHQADAEGFLAMAGVFKRVDPEILAGAPVLETPMTPQDDHPSVVAVAPPLVAPLVEEPPPIMPTPTPAVWPEIQPQEGGGTDSPDEAPPDQPETIDNLSVAHLRAMLPTMSRAQCELFLQQEQQGQQRVTVLRDLGNRLMHL